jgi:plasmid stabilization system protein ParE
MNYSLHPEAEGDLRDAASFYLEQAGTTTLSQSFFGEFEHSINRLLQHPALGAPWRGRGTTQVRNEALPLFVDLYSIRG